MLGEDAEEGEGVAFRMRADEVSNRGAEDGVVVCRPSLGIASVTGVHPGGSGAADNGAGRLLVAKVFYFGMKKEHGFRGVVMVTADEFGNRILCGFDAS